MSKSTENMNTIGRMITKMDYVLANVFTSWNSVAYMSNMDSKLPTLPATKRIGPYILGKTLGIGSTGRVKLGMHYKTKSRVAIKIVPKFPNKKGKSDDSSYFKKLEREITIMKLIRHDNIMTLHDVYETKDELFLVMELIEGGELFDYLVKKGRLGEEEARLFFQQILLGLDFCHRHLICHRDLKPENLLLDSNRNIKIADFGMARFQMDGKMLETSCGSPHYASPEIIKGIKYDGPPSDIWSCGVILYALLSGSLPFDDDNIRRLLAKVKAGVYQIPEHISSSAQNLIERMLVIDPKKRITMDEIFYHPWFTNDGKQGIARTQIPREIQEVEPIQDIDPEIVKNLTYLGWEESELVKPLISEDKNIEKIFYNLLFERKKHPFYQIDSDDDANSSADGSSPRRRIELNSNHNSRESMLANIYKRRSDMHSSSPDISNLDLAWDKKSKNTLNIQIPTTSEPNIVNPPSPFHRKHKDPSQYPATPIMNDTPTKVYNSEMFTFNKDLPTIFVLSTSGEAEETMKKLKIILGGLNVKSQTGRKHGLKCRQDSDSLFKDDPKPLKFRVELGTRPPRESDMEIDEFYITFQLQSGYLEQFKKLNDDITLRWEKLNK